MAITIFILVGLVFALLGLVFVATVAVGLPGAWMILGLAVAIELLDTLYLDPGEDTFGWPLLIGMTAIAGVGELLELGAGALGAKTAGSSRRGMVGALMGGLIGAVAGLGIPVPVIGSLIGAVIGTFVGAIVGELSDGEATVRDSLRPATGATIGRILGTVSKVPIAFVIWIGLTVAVFWP